MDTSKVAIVIPAFNEAQTIQSVITELQDTVSGIDIIVVDDGSSDDTAANAGAMGITLVSQGTNRGYSEAINRGFSVAAASGQYEYVVTVDADGQHDPQSVFQVIQAAFDGDMDIVIGQRNKPARISEMVFALYFRLKFGIKDPLCGLRLYRLSMFTQYGKFETFDSIGSELMTWALVKGKRYSTVDVNIRGRLDNPRFGSGIKVNLRILKSLWSTISFIRGSKM
ncbi:putative Glycosyltransferase [Shewanella benthica]|uniref:Putative Glycosyltransferase n=1 Tax=Shewanella benthica TaxID=43661 RepID=A0A330M9A5_9GAMM|nr:glycosyltransferase family 2 protein [Shewanella benthica]SQH77580.1 putative Glycosyltransferase [Shewanella benthica]